MSTLLVSLQSKSDQEKAVLATLAAVAITGILFITWGYNFAHSGKINNLASSAVGAASAVEEARLGETFTKAVEQLKAIGGAADTITAQEPEVQNTEDSVGAKHINVFEQEFGENPADILY